MGLLIAHLELAGKEAREGVLTESSNSQQTQAGMNVLSKDELLDVAQLNELYLIKSAGLRFIKSVVTNKGPRTDERLLDADTI